MRQAALSFTVVTGHEDPDADGGVDWEAIAAVGGTIVILMGAARMGGIAGRLQRGGLAPETTVASIHWGTRPEQEVTRATLATIGDHELAAPSTVVVGAVAALDLAWFAPAVRPAP
jgi:siroheme synthase